MVILIRQRNNVHQLKLNSAVVGLKLKPPNKMKSYIQPAGIVCNVLHRQLKVTKNNREEVNVVVQHLNLLAQELDLMHKRPRILFYRNTNHFINYGKRKELFRMFASMSVMQLAEKN